MFILHVPWSYVMINIVYCNVLTTNELIDCLTTNEQYVLQLYLLR
jgi:hypothetical protein